MYEFGYLQSLTLITLSLGTKTIAIQLSFPQFLLESWCEMMSNVFNKSSTLFTHSKKIASPRENLRYIH